MPKEDSEGWRWSVGVAIHPSGRTKQEEEELQLLWPKEHFISNLAASTFSNPLWKRHRVYPSASVSRVLGLQMCVSVLNTGARFPLFCFLLQTFLTIGSFYLFILGCCFFLFVWFFLILSCFIVETCVVSCSPGLPWTLNPPESISTVVALMGWLPCQALFYPYHSVIATWKVQKEGRSTLNPWQL